MGSPSTPEQEPTEQEIAQFEIATKQWEDYQKYAPQEQETLMRKTTGYVPDGDGGLRIAAGGLLNNDGTTKTDTGVAMAQASQQWAGLDRPMNPNNGAVRMGNVDVLGKKLESDAAIETGTLLGQQNRPIQGMQQVIGLGRGQQASASEGMMQQAGIAANQAAADANSAFADQSANRHLLGAAIGAVGGYQAYNYDKANNNKMGKTSSYFNLLG